MHGEAVFQVRLSGASSGSRKEKVRLLLACPGWPSGLIEIASWARHQDLAEAVIFQLQPGLAFQFDPDDADLLVPGPVGPELMDAFARRRWPLSPDARVVRLDDVCEIHDPQRAVCYRVAGKPGDRLDVRIPDPIERPAFLGAIRRYALSRGRGDQLFTAAGALSRPATEAVLAVGGEFVVKLIEFRPHVVGFRLEGGDFDEVKQYIRAVRLFSDAEVVLGGPTATSHPQEVLDDSGADYVFAGEAEEPLAQFLRLAHHRDSKDRQPEVPGLAFRYGGRTYHNTLPADGYERTALDDGSARCAEALRCLRNAARPVASADVLRANRLDWSLLKNFRRPFDSLFFTGGRGCPGACTFCARLHGQEVRIKPAEQLLEEIAAADAKVRDGTLRVTRWNLLQHAADPSLRDLELAWAAIYDEDFFLHRRRAVEFFRLWTQSPLRHRYRLGFQTNPCTLLGPGQQFHPELLEWIDRLTPMIQVGGESFNPEVLTRWRKRHTAEQLTAVLDGLERTGQDYSVFVLLSDFDTTPEELVETLRLLVLGALPRRRMRIASSPFTIPLYESETRRQLEFRGLLSAERIRHFTDYERPQPGWMDPLTADLADLADSELRWALDLPHRDAALIAALQAVVDRIREERQRTNRPAHRERLQQLHHQAQRVYEEVLEVRFQLVS